MLRLAAVIGAALVLMSCTGPTSTSTSEPATTSAAPASATTSRPSIVIGGLIPADPATLVPFDDAEPLVISWWHDGVVSPNGRWAAVRSGLEEAQSNQISLVDLETLQVVREGRGVGAGLHIDDRGLSVWFDDGALTGLSPDEEWPDLASPGPVPAELNDTLIIFGDGRIAYLLGPQDETGPASIVLVDEHEPAEIVLNDVLAGPTSPVDVDLPSRGYVAPAVAWDEPRNRALVVSASDNTVHMVDLETGVSEEHSFQSSVTPDDQGVGRDAYLSPDGTVLLIATRTLTVTGNADDWMAVDSAEDVVIVDTTDWSSRAVEQSGWDFVASPGGDHVAAVGAEVTRASNDESNRVQNPVYLFDGPTGQPLVGFESRSGAIANVQFSGDGAQMYVVSENDEGTNIDIIDVATRQLAGSIGFTGISLIGQAGLLAFHTAQ